MKVERSGSESGSISQRHGSADPDPQQNVMDPQHCREESSAPAASVANEDGQKGPVGEPWWKIRMFHMCHGPISRKRYENHEKQF
jgi:hypothetical protein